MSKVREILAPHFPDIVFTETMISAAYGQSEEAEPYANMMASCTTNLSREDLTSLLKSIERQAGNTRELRRQGVVMMDIDLMEYASVRCHDKDWDRPYIKKLYSALLKLICLLLCWSATVCAQGGNRRNNTADSELLGKAVEYYMGEKYHECTLTLEKLKKTYKLTPRILAYLGFSYYKEAKYKEATECLTSAIPQLSAFSSKEQAVYMYACAESFFMQQQYARSIDFYDKLTELTEGNDKGDVLFHRAFSVYLDKQIENHMKDLHYLEGISDYITQSYKDFTEALSLYKANVSSATPLQTARMKQCEIMIKGYEEELLPNVHRNATILH